MKTEGEHSLGPEGSVENMGCYAIIRFTQLQESELSFSY